jgi:hypothetical protein
MSFWPPLATRLAYVRLGGHASRCFAPLAITSL